MNDLGQLAVNIDYAEPPAIIRTHSITIEEAEQMDWSQSPDWAKCSADQLTMLYGLQLFQPLIPDWSAKRSGHLLASWNPNQNDQKNPTVVIQHGGVGVCSTDYGHGAWFKAQGYNVLVLDSFWSRGFSANWRKIDAPVSSHGPHYSALGANTRARDAFASAQWLREQPEVDQNKIFLIGSSQGGWGVLRAFTDEKSITENYKGLFRAGVAIYPVCWSWQHTPGTRSDNVPEILNPRLSPYHSPLMIISVGLEPLGSATDINSGNPNITKLATIHVRYLDQTHAFDAEPPPGEEHGRCWYSTNPNWCKASGGRDPVTGNCIGSSKADMCEDPAATLLARRDMIDFLDQYN